MAKVQCEYCGSYIQDTDEQCTVCGAVNNNYQRIVKETPSTIEELQSWYKARNLPPEEITRFFIGKDIKEPKAFGIYKKTNGDFVVYKNKANGQRAIRYQGTDEAYAVNELYLRLKEEILNQKSHNIDRRKQTPYTNTTYTNTKSRGQTKRQSSFLRVLFLLFGVPIFTVIASNLLIFGMLQFALSGIDPIDNGYYLNNDTLYYYDSNYVNDDEYIWWVFDNQNFEWDQNQIYNESNYIDGINESHFVDNEYDTLTEKFSCSWDQINIKQSHKYIDAGHHDHPTTGYYLYNDKYYYYLYDQYGSSSNNKSGWYEYDKNSESWDYYGSYDNKDLFDDSMWYEPDENKIGDEHNIYEWNAEQYSWQPTQFSDTSWYKTYQSNKTSYEDRQNSNNDDDDWDYDSDYDWDSDDDWDYDDTDWDSDW